MNQKFVLLAQKEQAEMALYVKDENDYKLVVKKQCYTW